MSDSQSTSIHKIREIIQKKQEEQQQIKEEHQQKKQEEQQIKEENVHMNSYNKNNDNENKIITIENENQDIDWIKYFFITMLLFLFISSLQIDEIILTFIGEDNKTYIPLIKFGISGGVVYYIHINKLLN